MSLIQFFLSSQNAGVPDLPHQPDVTYTELSKTRTFLSDLLSRRGDSFSSDMAPRLVLEHPVSKLSQVQAVPINGATFIPVTAFEPDPATCRSKYYYNATSNTLYQRSFVENRPSRGKILAVWKRISQPTDYYPKEISKRSPTGNRAELRIGGVRTTVAARSLTNINTSTSVTFGHTSATISVRTTSSAVATVSTGHTTSASTAKSLTIINTSTNLTFGHVSSSVTATSS